MELGITTPNIAGVQNMDDPEHMIIPEGTNCEEIFEMVAMQVKGQFEMMVKMYNMVNIISGKKFPFPMKIFFSKKEKYSIIGTESAEFPNRRTDLTNETKKHFSLFYLCCKLQDEDNWMSLNIVDKEHSIFSFSNGKSFKYGY
jgi:hypothetical protein